MLKIKKYIIEIILWYNVITYKNFAEESDDTMRDILLKLIMQFLTVDFAKKLIVKVATWLVNKTKIEKDNEILDMIKEEWGGGINV